MPVNEFSTHNWHYQERNSVTDRSKLIFFFFFGWGVEYLMYLYHHFFSSQLVSFWACKVNETSIRSSSVRDLNPTERIWIDDDDVAVENHRVDPLQDRGSSWKKSTYRPACSTIPAVSVETDLSISEWRCSPPPSGTSASCPFFYLFSIWKK